MADLRIKIGGAASLNSKKNDKKIFVFIWAAMIIVIALIAILAFNFNKPGQISKETSKLVSQRISECKFFNPNHGEGVCKDMALFSVGISKIDKGLCDYIKSEAMREECENTLDI